MMKKGSLLTAVLMVAPWVSAQSPFYVHQPVESSTISAFIPGGAISGADPITRLIADDLLLPSAYVGQSITEIRLHLSNLSSEQTVAVRPRLRFWLDNAGISGPNGLSGPGTYLGGLGITANPVTLHKGTSVDQVITLDPGFFTLPANRFWLGITLDNQQNGTGLATYSELNQIGVGLSEPVQPQSTSALFSTSAAGSFYNVLNPTGTFENVGSSATGNLRVSLAVPGQDFTGSISLNDVTGMATTRTIQYSVIAGNFVLESGDLTVGTTSPNQGFSFTTPFAPPAGGALQVVFNGSTFLRRVVTLPAPGATPTLIDLGVITLVNGDVDESGEVDAADIDEVIADFGSAESGNTDVDVSGEVDAADIDIVIANFGAADE